MKQLIEKLNRELHEINHRKKDLETAIQALQKICNHNWEAAGNTHKEREICSECGEEISF